MGTRLVDGQLSDVVRGLALAMLLPHLVEQLLDVGGVGLDVEQRAGQTLLPNSGPGSTKAVRKKKKSFSTGGK